ncbi:MAG: hypothetical protein DRP80_05820 [Candidatus Omnitrophota bacterium]|nr:MAG: hypothetical protein DRP69_05715 [Candidatus Omnitrophota bacterium]RKY43213.1 MAG: hypothetical protein DRP80_05820 [Candidatus Omnitrophota bacterium]
MRARIEKRTKPFLHFLVSSSKKIHGWYDWGRRECTSERFLLNPYCGCGLGCFYCYTRAFPGYFKEFHQKGYIFVFKDFDQKVASQLDSLNIGFCGYLSPVSEPFQKIDKFYNISFKIAKVFIERNLPLEFITKEKVPLSIIKLLRTQEHSFGQVSILTLNPKLSKILSNSYVEVLLENIKRLSENRIFSVCRVDPIIPYINDNKAQLRRLLEEVKKRGANHLVTSVLDIPFKIKDFVFRNIKKISGETLFKKISSLYKEKIGYLHADINYRKDIFSFLRREADRLGLTFSLCMEYELKGSQILGLNREFSSSLNCEGRNVPLYKRKGKKFYPVEGCLGNCLTCKEPVCGIEELAYGKTRKPLALKYSDYRRFSQRIDSQGLG